MRERCVNAARLYARLIRSQQKIIMDSTTTKQSRQQPAIERAGAWTGVGHYRWVICALLFFATSINYIDRQIIGLLKQTLQGQIGWNEIDYSNIIFAFQLAYAVGLLVAGRLLDRLGTRK